MPNNIELITKYSTEAWDKVYKAEAISSVLDAPSTNVRFEGAKTVKIAKFMAGGLGNYYRNNDGDERVSYGTPYGYSPSEVGLVWEEFTMRQDRSARYPVEMFDDEETGGLVLGAATKEISRTIMVPEIDAYCFSEVASYASTELGNYVEGNIDAAVGTAYNLLDDALVYFDEHEVPAENQVIFVSPRFLNLLRKDSRAISRLLQSDFDKKVKFTVMNYEGRQMIMVPPERFRTLIDLSGKGVKWKDGSKHIDFMVVAKDAVMHVVKYNKVKIIGGDANLVGANFDGYSIFARVYHDVFVPDNKRFAIYAHVGATTLAPKVEPVLKIELDEDNRVTNIIATPADKALRVGYVEGGSAPATVPETIKRLRVGDVITASGYAYSYYVDGENDVLLKTAEITVA